MSKMRRNPDIPAELWSLFGGLRERYASAAPPSAGPMLSAFMPVDGVVTMTGAAKVKAAAGAFVGTTAGKLVLGATMAAAAVGGAHAAGVVDVPGLPDSTGSEAVVETEPPAPSDCELVGDCQTDDPDDPADAVGASDDAEEPATTEADALEDEPGEGVEPEVQGDVTEPLAESPAGGDDGQGGAVVEPPPPPPPPPPLPSGDAQESDDDESDDDHDSDDHVGHDDHDGHEKGKGKGHEKGKGRGHDGDG